jgi:signal transduction histidine kinase
VLSGSVEPAPLLINDTHTDPTFQLHRAAAATPNIGSFIGVPIILGTGEFYGTLCAVDPAAQALTLQQADLLVVLGRIIATQIERDRELAARRHAEAEQQRLYLAAQDAVREREALLSIASHELKNPLTSLLGYAHMIQRRNQRAPSLAERDERALDTIVTQAERMEHMLGDLLDVSRVDGDQFTVEQLALDLTTLAHRLVDELQPTLARHTVVVHEPDSPVMVSGDEVRLTQVLRNLIGNAVKYSPAGGTIDVRIEALADQAQLSVADQGIGIPQAALEQLFQRFYRAPNTRAHAIDGFGIGLYVVKRIVVRHGGTIGVTSTEDVGTTFTVQLPLLAPFA